MSDLLLNDSGKSSTVKQFWAEVAARDTSASPNQQDMNQAYLEVQAILNAFSRLLEKTQVLEIGCANGYLTRKLAQFDGVDAVLGVDFILEFIKQAQVNAHPKTTFQVGDVRQLRLPSNSFDVVVSKRCLINLILWSQQKQALLEIHRVLKPAGTLIMLEASRQGYKALNRARREAGLAPVLVSEHNLPIDLEHLKQLDYKFRVVGGSILNTYYFITRILHPLLVEPDEPKYDAPINVCACQLQDTFGDCFECYSPLILYEMKKKYASAC